MFEVQPDIHHINIFGALAYITMTVSPKQKKHDSNVKK